MAKGYLVVTYRKINNPEKWGAYAKIAGVAIPKLGGKFIVRGMPAEIYEKGIRERVVIVEFDSVQKAKAAHDSAEYAEALKALGDGAERDMRLVEGVA
ncbi:MAG TPA: DUF1330 domain-containing protein [Burkholderiales bacterium]|nr:DUF1330 domain-containing protein [Burkholderiales bacterium]